MENYQLDEFKAKLGNDIKHVIACTPAPAHDSPAYVYYIRIQEILDVLRRSGVEVN